MKLKISELKPNPFKKEINEGKLDEKRIEVMFESIEHGTLPEHFTARKNNDKFELTSGHHRVEAIKRKKGRNYEVTVDIVKYSDEQMLIDMVRENLTQRDTDFHDTEGSVVLAKRWLESGTDSVKGLYTVKKHGHFQGIGSRQIALFLSKNGKTISHSQIEKYLNIAEDLIPEIHDVVTKGSQGHTEENMIGLELGAKIATFDKGEQKQIFEAVKVITEEGISQEKANHLLTDYRKAPEEIKSKVLKGEVKLNEIEGATIDNEIIESNKDKESRIFIPNFDERLRQFSYEVDKLELQVSIFGKIFKSKNFSFKYNSLGNKERKFLDTSIYSIQDRVKKCNEEVDFFAKQLDSAKQIEVSK